MGYNSRVVEQHIRCFNPVVLQVRNLPQSDVGSVRSLHNNYNYREDCRQFAHGTTNSCSMATSHQLSGMSQRCSSRPMMSQNSTKCHGGLTSQSMAQGVETKAGGTSWPLNFTTLVCNSFLKTGTCPRGDKCLSTHVEQSTTLLSMGNGNYKTRLCKNFEPNGRGECNYGDRCKFIHPNDREYKKGATPRKAYDPKNRIQHLRRTGSVDDSHNKFHRTNDFKNLMKESTLSVKNIEKKTEKEKEFQLAHLATAKRTLSIPTNDGSSDEKRGCIQAVSQAVKRGRSGGEEASATSRTSSRSNSPQPKRVCKGKYLWAPGETLKLGPWLSELDQTKYWSRWKDFEGRIQAGDQPAKLYPDLDIPPNETSKP